MHTRYKLPIKRDVMMAGFKRAEAEFLAAGFDPATAVKMARERVSHYRIAAGATKAELAKVTIRPQTMGKLRRMKPENAFSEYMILDAIERGGVL